MSAMEVDGLGQMPVHLQAFFGSLYGNQAYRSSHAPGGGSHLGWSGEDESAGMRQPDGRLPEGFERSCRSFIFKIERAKLQAAELQDQNLITWLDERRQELDNMLPPPGRSLFLELPAELREQIWIHAVTEWSPNSPSSDSSKPREEEPTTVCPMWTSRELAKKPIRIDRFNRPLPPSITLVSQQLREETLHLWYQHNVFECWRPLFWLNDWSQSTFIDWLVSLGPKKTKWLREIVLLYKHEGEIEHDIESALVEEGFQFMDCAIVNKQELSEYELCFEELGLPRHFGKKRRWDRWLAGSV